MSLSPELASRLAKSRARFEVLDKEYKDYKAERADIIQSIWLEDRAQTVQSITELLGFKQPYVVRNALLELDEFKYVNGKPPEEDEPLILTI